MDKNFRVRFIVGFGIFVVAVVSMYTFNEIPFKILFGIFALVAAVELFSFFKRKISPGLVILALLEFAFLVGGTIFASKIDVSHFWYIILGVPGYDIFAYLFGKTLGGKIIKNSRPFPHISKNKTWEGTFMGLVCSFLLVGIILLATNSTDYLFLLAGPLAVIGDLFESFLKRRYKIKDSSEIVVKNPFFDKFEILVGGRGGHGGYLDRIDSMAFTATILLILL